MPSKRKEDSRVKPRGAHEWEKLIRVKGWMDEVRIKTLL